MKRGITLLICLVLQSSVLSVDFVGGTGEPNDPYQIATAKQLIAVGSDRDLLEKHYILVADIDLDPNLPGGRIFEDALIARDESSSVNIHFGRPFSGVFDGQGHTIANLHVVGKDGHDAGLFGWFDGLVKDLNLIDVVVSGSPCGAIAGLNKGMILRCRVTGEIAGINQVGGLVGALWDGSLLECRAEALVTGEENVGGMVGGGPGGSLVRCDVQAQVNGETNIGGLIGEQGGGLVIECRTAGNVIGGDNVGGLIGESDEDLILRSSAHCDVTAERTAGGLVGYAYWGFSQVIADCYVQGSVTGSLIGGLAGVDCHNQLLNCYAAFEIFPVQLEGEELFVGGLFGDVEKSEKAPLTDSCFWDIELSQIAIGANASQEEQEQTLQFNTGLTTEQMQNREVFENAGWDFNTIWMIDEGDYPRH